MRLKHKADLYNIAKAKGISKETADQFIFSCLYYGMIEELCDGWYIDHE